MTIKSIKFAIKFTLLCLTTILLLVDSSFYYSNAMSRFGSLRFQQKANKLKLLKKPKQFVAKHLGKPATNEEESLWRYSSAAEIIPFSEACYVEFDDNGLVESWYVRSE